MNPFTMKSESVKILSCLWLSFVMLIPTNGFSASNLREDPNNCSDTYLRKTPRQVLPCYLLREDGHYQWHLEKTDKIQTEANGRKADIIVYTLGLPALAHR